MALSIRERISNALIKKGLISKKDLDAVLNLQKKKGGKLSDILVNEDFVKREDLTAIISQELGIPPINLSRYKIDPQVLNLIPRKIALQYNILPVSKMANLLSVAMVDPLNVFAMDDIKTLTGLRISPVLATEKDMKEAIEQCYGEDAHQAVEEIIDNIEEAKRIQMIEEEGGEEIDSATLMRLTQEAPVVKVTDMLLDEGIRLRASDILVEPLEHEMRVRYRVDGILQEGPQPPKSMHEALISRLKVMSKLKIAERRLPQDGRFKIKVHNHEVDFRISVLPSSFGEKAALRILDKSQAMLDVDRLGFEKKPLDELKESSLKPHGMILVCGPTGCGKTTTLYSVLRFIDTPEKNLVTVEDPIEYDLRGINQVAIRPNIGLTFASCLRSILRQDPDIIMVGEIRDYETVDIAIKSALTGHLVLSTLHTTTASGSIVRLINMGVEPFLISSSVVLVAAQRLVRKVCGNCKESYKLSGSLVKKLKLEDLKQPVVMYRGAGCEKCRKTGYKGRVGLIECLKLTPAIRELISSKAQEGRVREEARKEGMKTLRENGLAKALAGITSLEEIVRVTAEEREAA